LPQPEERLISEQEAHRGAVRVELDPLPDLPVRIFNVDAERVFRDLYAVIAPVHIARVKAEHGALWMGNDPQFLFGWFCDRWRDADSEHLGRESRQSQVQLSRGSCPNIKRAGCAYLSMEEQLGHAGAHAAQKTSAVQFRCHHACRDTQEFARGRALPSGEREKMPFP